MTTIDIEYELAEARSEIARHHDLITRMRDLLHDWREMGCYDNASHNDCLARTAQLLDREVG